MLNYSVAELRIITIIPNWLQVNVGGCSEGITPLRILISVGFQTRSCRIIETGTVVMTENISIRCFSGVS